mmetsp:Transcript_19811/g.38489  ORF Transcript_19811/g.38489 Transcript_19811/m.38489 type:complete len:121 (+) Transcript_19811:688-1050(+)
MGSVLIPQVSHTAVDGCCLSSGNRPLFTSAFARDRIHVPGQFNEIYMELVANVVLAHASQITLSGLTGTQTPGTNAMVVPLVVSVVESLYYCECIEACDRHPLRFSVPPCRHLVRSAECH